MYSASVIISFSGYGSVISKKGMDGIELKHSFQQLLGTILLMGVALESVILLRKRVKPFHR